MIKTFGFLFYFFFLKCLWNFQQDAASFLKNLKPTLDNLENKTELKSKTGIRSSSPSQQITLSTLSKRLHHKLWGVKTHMCRVFLGKTLPINCYKDATYRLILMKLGPQLRYDTWKYVKHCFISVAVVQQWQHARLGNINQWQNTYIQNT